jgi:hypothetical protein
VETKTTDSLKDAEIARDGSHLNGKNNNRIADTTDIRISLEELAKLHPPASVLEPQDNSETHNEHQRTNNDIEQSSSSPKVDNVRRHEQELKRQRELNAGLEKARMDDERRRRFQMHTLESSSTTKNTKDTLSTESSAKEDRRLHGIAKTVLWEFQSKSSKAEISVRMNNNNREHTTNEAEPGPPVSKAQKLEAGKVSRARVSMEEDKGTERFEMDHLGGYDIDHKK